MTATAQSSARATAAATATATAPGRKHAPAHAPKRPPLRVVQPNERAGRRLSARLLVAGGVVLGGAVLFALVAAHVMLTQNQFRLQEVQKRAAEEQARYERLRAQVAELESPSRIVAAAQERLGMVPPASVKYLTPAGAVGGTPSTSTASAPAPGPSQTQRPLAQTNNKADSAGATGRSAKKPTTLDDDAQATTEWSAVKRQLSGSRP